MLSSYGSTRRDSLSKKLKRHTNGCLAENGITTVLETFNAQNNREETAADAEKFEGGGGTNFFDESVIERATRRLGARYQHFHGSSNTCCYHFYCAGIISPTEIHK